MSSTKNNAHQENILYQSNKGYVVYCECCKIFHIAYGTVSFDQDEKGYQCLMNDLKLYYEKYQNSVDPDMRCVQVLTPFEGFRLLLSTSEILEFSGILNEAYFLFDTERIANDQK